MKAKTYLSEKTRSQHTYAFFKARRNDPEWQADFWRIKYIRRRNTLLQLVFILVLLALGAFAYNGYRKTNHNQLVNTASSATATMTASSASSVASTQSSSASSTNTAKSVVVSDYSRYASYSGQYQSTDFSLALDFTKGLMTTTGVTTHQRFYFDQVIHHPDGSLIINIHGNYIYNAYDGSGAKTKLTYLSILFAPKNKIIQKNWQTNVKIDDQTDSSVDRLTFATSDNQGKTFNMEPAYDAFANNTITVDAGDATLATIYTPM